MDKLYDCFLYNNEIEILEIRLQLLSEVVDKFIIVCASETFTGRKKEYSFPWSNKIISSFKNKIELITIEQLIGEGAWQKEWYSRNRLSDGLNDLSPNDLVLISDIDEIPRPTVLSAILNGNPINDIKILGLDFYNFKFNYKLMHGTQIIWAGPVICAFKNFTSPQELRNLRWTSICTNKERLIENAGWHFSFLTKSNNVEDKLRSFAHQEPEVQTRLDDVNNLIENRQGFSDHQQPGSVWATVSLEDYNCAELTTLVSKYTELYLTDSIDDEEIITKKIRASTHNLCKYERSKILRMCTIKELIHELIHRYFRRLKSMLVF